MSGPGEVVGIDLSTAMLANARVRSAAAGLELEGPAPHRHVSAPLGGMTHR
jgi:ubiquinone/menaquinone biosynthesis C-methylase UbiE